MAKDTGDWATYQLHLMFRSCTDSVARERRREVLSESRMREIYTSRFDESGVWKRSYG